MGLPSVKEKNLENLTKRFSDNILKIELCGLEHYHLSVIDMPGLFHSKNDRPVFKAAELTLGRSYQVPDYGGP